jgi:hypothetical protein
MTRFKLIIGCLILFSFSLSAQNKFGFAAGVNYSKVAFSIKTKTQPTTNYFVGIYHTYYAKQKFKLSG